MNAIAAKTIKKSSTARKFHASIKPLREIESLTIDKTLAHSKQFQKNHGLHHSFKKSTVFSQKKTL